MQLNASNKTPIKRIQHFLSDIFRTPKKLAILIALILFCWLFFVGDHKRFEETTPAKDTQAANSVDLVQVRTSNASAWDQSVELQGQVLPWRKVTIKAEVSGTVQEITKQQGEPVKQGDILLALSDEGRQAQLAQAEADLEFARLELKSAETLKTSKFVSETELSRFKAALAAAQARLETAQLAADYGQPKAPFDGIVDRRHIEVGDQVKGDAALFDIVQIDKLKVTAFVPQQQISLLQEGSEVELSLLNGDKLKGMLSFISMSADEATRSYYIEIEVDNADTLRIAGASVSVSIPAPSTLSHSVSPALLYLDKNGKPGLYAVNDSNTVEYYSVNVLSVGNQAVVSGLPETVRLITVGSGFVKTGQVVEVSEPTL